MVFVRIRQKTSGFREWICPMINRSTLDFAYGKCKKVSIIARTETIAEYDLDLTKEACLEATEHRLNVLRETLAGSTTGRREGQERPRAPRASDGANPARDWTGTPSQIRYPHHTGTLLHQIKLPA